MDVLSPIATHELQRLRKSLARQRNGELETRAHTAHVLLLIDRALDIPGERA